MATYEGHVAKRQKTENNGYGMNQGGKVSHVSFLLETRLVVGNTNVVT